MDSAEERRDDLGETGATSGGDHTSALSGSTEAVGRWQSGALQLVGQGHKLEVVGSSWLGRRLLVGLHSLHWIMRVGFSAQTTTGCLLRLPFSLLPA